MEMFGEQVNLLGKITYSISDVVMDGFAELSVKPRQNEKTKTKTKAIWRSGSGALERGLDWRLRFGWWWVSEAGCPCTAVQTHLGSTEV